MTKKKINKNLLYIVARLIVAKFTTFFKLVIKKKKKYKKCNY